MLHAVGEGVGNKNNTIRLVNVQVGFYVLATDPISDACSPKRKRRHSLKYILFWKYYG
jgi:hypothetical protein